MRDNMQLENEEHNIRTQVRESESRRERNLKVVED